jgi:hypothetical protein
MKSFPARLRVLRTSSLVGLAAGAMSFPFIGIMEFFRSNVTSEPIPGMILVAVPLLMTSVSFMATAAACLAYNGGRRLFRRRSAKVPEAGK